MDNEDDLLTPGEVARKLRVDPKTVTRWAKSGKIGSVRTPGGHRRLFRRDVQAILNGTTEDVQATLDGKEPRAV